MKLPSPRQCPPASAPLRNSLGHQHRPQLILIFLHLMHRPHHNPPAIVQQLLQFIPARNQIALALQEILKLLIETFANVVGRSIQIRSEMPDAFPRRSIFRRVVRPAE